MILIGIISLLLQLISSASSSFFNVQQLLHRGGHNHKEDHNLGSDAKYFLGDEAEDFEKLYLLVYI